MSAPSPASDRNLLFGILALQLNFISRDALVAALHAWVLDRGKALGQILHEQSQLPDDRRQLLEALVEEHVRAHGDARRSLASLPTTGPDHNALRAIPDADLQASMGHVGSAWSASPTPAAPSLPVRLPTGRRFRVLRSHARGGLGEVFVAHDEELNREVALKEIHPDRADDRVSRARFLVEAEITGRLEHPGVVPVYSLGTYDDGRPFYAMRFVQGDNFMEAIRRYHGDRAASRTERNVAFRELLGRFVDICQAVAYAHSRGVLHRDLKPGNVMLGMFGETLVVDWGFAKAVGRPPVREEGADESTLRPARDSDTPQTQMGQAMGTPAYMSPEQAAGRLDELGPASDVYSLGATLYALLAGRPPFASNEGDLLRKVERGDFPTPRQVNPKVPRALEAVCLKAMAQRPADRYPSALALAADVERWLADEAVGAYRDPPWVRLARWGRRHRSVVAALAALVGAAVVGLAVGLWAVNRERAQKELALRAEESARKETREALNTLTDDAVQRLMARQVKLTAEDRAFLAKVLSFHERFTAAGGDTADGRASVADGHFRVGLIRYRLGEEREAEAAYRTAMDLRQALADEFPENRDNRRDLGASHLSLGELYHHTGRIKPGEEAFLAARDLFRALADEAPDVADHRKGLSNSLFGLGHLYEATGRPKDAEVAYRAARDLRRMLVDDFPDVPEYQGLLAGGRLNLGTRLMYNGRLEEAEAEFRAALALQRQLIARSPDAPDHRDRLARSHNNLGVLLRGTGRLREAEAEFRAAHAARHKLAADFPTVPDYRRSLALSHNNMGYLFRRMGRPEEAEAEFRERRAELRRKLADGFPDVPEYRHAHASSRFDLASQLYQMGRAKEAEAEFRATLAEQQKLVERFPGNPEYRRILAFSHKGLADLLGRAERQKEAEQEYRAARGHQEKVAESAPTSPEYRAELGLTLAGLGRLLAESGRRQEAEEVLGTARALQLKVAEDIPNAPDAHGTLALTLIALARLRNEAKDHAAALPLLAQAMSHNQAALRTSPNNPTYRQTQRDGLATLARSHLGLADHAGAAEAADRLAGFGYHPANDAYGAARVLALCAPLATKDVTLPEARRTERAQAHADRAMDLLRQAVRHGYKDVAQMRKETDLDPLRSREDFQKLLGGLEAAPKPR